MVSSGRLARVLQRLHSTSSRARPPLRHWPIVGDGWAGRRNPPYGPIRLRPPTRSASRAARWTASRAPWARDLRAHDAGPPQITSRFLVLMVGDCSELCRKPQFARLRRPEQPASPPVGQERAKRRLAAVIVRALSWQVAAGWAALPHSILGGYPHERKAHPAVPKATYARPAPLISAAGDR